MKFRLMPTNREFFDDFSAAAANLAHCVQLLQQLLADADDREARHQAVKAAERKGDAYTHTILERLDSSFVTPFDPEDIHRLAEAVDDVVDDVYHVSEMVVLMGITQVIPELGRQVDVLDRMVTVLIEIFDRLESMRGLRELVDELHRLETEGDGIYREAMVRLFAGDIDPLDVIKWKDVCESMEEALDRVEDVSDIIGSIVVKHA